MSKKLWNKDFILLLQGSSVSIIGDLMYSVAIGYWVYEKTGSSALMGLMSSISMFVTMFLSPFAGSIVDKLSRKRVLVGVDVVQGVLMIGIGILAYKNQLSVPAVLLVALVAAFGSVFYSPAVGTLMIDIIPHDDMVRGQSIFSGVQSLINMAGTAFSGVMVSFFGVPLIVVLNGMSNLYCALSEAFVHVPKTVQQGQPVSVKGILRSFREALQMIFGDKCLRIFVPGALILNLLSAGVTGLVLPFILERGFPVDYYGYFMSVYTAAYVICVLLLGIVKLSPKVRFWVMAIGFSLSEFFLCGAYLSVEFVPLCVMLFIGAFMNSAGNAVFNAALLLALPEENRGAIMGFIQAASTGGVALSTVIYGILGDIFPLYLVFAVGSMLSVGPVLYLCFHRETKRFILEH